MKNWPENFSKPSPQKRVYLWTGSVSPPENALPGWRLNGTTPRPASGLAGVGLGHIEAKNKGLTEPYESSINTMPSLLKDPDDYWTGLYASPLCFASNTEKLELYGLPAPHSWADLIKPEYRNHIQMANPGSSGTSYNTISTLIQLLGEQKAFEYLQKLDNNITHYTRSGLAPGKNMSIGEVAIAIGYTHDALRLKKGRLPRYGYLSR